MKYLLLADSPRRRREARIHLYGFHACCVRPTHTLSFEQPHLRGQRDTEQVDPSCRRRISFALRDFAVLGS